MTYGFNSDEIFQMAEQIERNGAKFYKEMAENISGAPVRQMLLDFVAMEEAHEKIFISMREDLSERERGPTVFDPEGETALYLQALADIRLFDEESGEGFVLSEELSEESKIRKILRAAVSMEWESIAFYMGMKDLVPENSGKGKIDDVIKEEMKHIRLLSNSITSLKE